MNAETMLGQSMQALDTVVLKKWVHLSSEVKKPGGLYRLWAGEK